jgi:DegV family protein with EDD domain
MIRIVTDSSSDLSPRLVAELGVSVIPVRISFGSRVFHDGVDLDRNGFYRQLAEGSLSPILESPLVEDFQSTYSHLLKTTDQILSIHLSSRLNNTERVAQEAAKTFLGRSRITVVDSKMVSWGLGLLVTLAAEAAQRGETLDQIVKLIRGAIPHIYMVFFAENLDHLERHAQRTKARLFGDGLLALRPLLIVEDGKITPLERVRSRGKPVERLFEFLAEFAHFDQAAVLQGRLGEEPQVLFGQLSEAFPEKRIDIKPYGAALATYLGPDCLGIGVYEGI